MSGVNKNEKWIIWVVLLWIIMTGGPGLLLASKPVFIGSLPVLYVYCLVGWLCGIVINIILVKKIRFVNVDEAERLINQMEKESMTKEEVDH